MPTLLVAQPVLGLIRFCGANRMIPAVACVLSIVLMNVLEPPITFCRPFGRAREFIPPGIMIIPQAIRCCRPHHMRHCVWNEVQLLQGKPSAGLRCTAIIRCGSLMILIVHAPPIPLL